jgi:dTDP-4-dehydrorhamnose reductase
MQPFGLERSDREKLLVTGVDGLVGANLAASLADHFDVLGLYETHPVALPECTTLFWSPADLGDWCDMIHQERPEWIIHCGPLSCGSWDVPEPCPGGEREARTCALLAEVARDVGSRLTVISSDAVFAGPRLFHDERAPAASGRPFARAVRRAEEALEGTGALVVRTHAYGWSPAGAPPGFAERVWEALIEGRSTHFDPDRHATPILAASLAELLWVAYRRGLKGRCHVAGAERTSAYRFAVELAAAFGLRGAEMPADDPLARCDSDHLEETSLCTRRARRELGRPMPMLREGLDRFAQQAADGYRARLQCCLPQAAAAYAA